MKNKIAYFVLILFTTFNGVAQTPQNVTQLDNEDKDSLWNSTNAIIFVAVLILLLIVGRTWSKKIQDKRDEMTKDDEGS